MIASKFILFSALMAVMAASCSAGILDYVLPSIPVEQFFAPDERPVAMDTYYDENTDTDADYMYTVDEDGNRYRIKNRKLSPKVLKSTAG